MCFSNIVAPQHLCYILFLNVTFTTLTLLTLSDEPSVTL